MPVPTTPNLWYMTLMVTVKQNWFVKQHRERLTEKGKRYFEKVRNNLNVHEKDFASIFDGNPMFTTSATVPQKGHDFLADLDNLSFSEDLKKYGGYPVRIPLWKRCFYKVKRIAKRILKR